jgi:hypothetical protein
MEFDTEAYANTYPDLKAAFGYDAKKLAEHYRDHGEREGREIQLIRPTSLSHTNQSRPHIQIFIVCFNEMPFLKLTIKFYMKLFPNASFTLLDNYSTDDSVEFAMSQGFRVVQWGHVDKKSNLELMRVKNSCWKSTRRPNQWTIIVDCDEWLQASESDLIDLRDSQITHLNIKAVHMVHDKVDETLFSASKGYPDSFYDKKVCFRSDLITDINYTAGAHSCKMIPVSKVHCKASSQTFLLKHYQYASLDFLLDKNKKNYSRTHDDRKLGMSKHYSGDEETITQKYQLAYSRSTDAYPLPDNLREMLEVQ